MSRGETMPTPNGSPGARLPGVGRGLAAALLLALVATPIGDRPAQANRFGPPFQALVAAEQTVIYDEPNSSATEVATLGNDSIVAVIEQAEGGWLKLPNG